MLSFCMKNAEISKLKGVMELKGIFSETTDVSVVMTKFQVFSKILASFRLGVILPLYPPDMKRTPKKPTRVRVKLLFVEIKLLQLKFLKFIPSNKCQEQISFFLFRSK